MKQPINAKPSLTEQVSEQVFVALQAKSAIQKPVPAGNKPVLFADIVQYVMGNDNNADAVYQAINSDLTKRRIYQQVLKQSRFAFGRREAHAQSAGEIASRQGDGFTIKLKFSRANSAQVFVILLIDESLLSAKQMQQQVAQQEKSLTLHISDDDQHQRLVFPPLLDGKSQLVLTADDLRLLLLRNINTELSLC